MRFDAMFLVRKLPEVYSFAFIIGKGTTETVLQEIPESRVTQLLSEKDFLTACDVAVFVYDSGDCYGIC
ncbi:hypothetical protein L6164_010103 [Bauhinia variegata]|uniref:Uncharacterized protein n=1 Tax=Bauhinia variegata TaxID=167791 RepID=A0ACB9PM88_BAUVA|nr:hypothetical protein L6164_010103 [Bauhinia variegata]